MSYETKVDLAFREEFKRVSGSYYNLGRNSRLFGYFMPDGWFINNNNELFIIENKCSRLQFEQAKKQLLKYKNKALTRHKFYNVYLIFAYGTGELMRYKIYDSEMNELNVRLKDLNLNTKLLENLDSEESELVQDVAHEFKISKKPGVLLKALENLINKKEEEDLYIISESLFNKNVKDAKKRRK
ncbi:MAG: hypothetical protein LBE13_09035 [Bacteroidales bacterium]|jgi:hypothetical protein|nr:hypothetical protein [Bacteroidales bacterium]